jgi:hypothetical protein
MMNIYGTKSVFPGLAIDGQNLAPAPGTCVLRMDPTTNTLQLSNNGGSFLDVNAGNSGKSVIAGTNIIVTSDMSSNWVVGTSSTPSFSTVTTSGSIISGGPLNAASAFIGGALTATTSITSSGSLNANTLVVSDTSNTADKLFCTLTNSGTADNAFKICATRGEVGNTPGSVVGRLGLFYGTSRTSCINFHRGGGAADGFMVFSTRDTERMRIDQDGIINVAAKNTQAATFFDTALSPSNKRKIQMGHSDTNSNCLNLTYNHTGLASSTNYISMGFNENPTALCINPAGNVGIRTTLPSYPLDVNGDSRLSGNIIGVQSFAPNSAVPANYNVNFKNNTGTSTGGLVISPWSDDRCLFTFTGTGQHDMRSRINGTSDTIFIAISNNGALHNWFRLGSNATNTAGAMKMAASMPQVYVDGSFKTMRPITGVVIATYSGSFSFTSTIFCGTAEVTISYSSGALIFTFPNYDCYASSLITTVRESTAAGGYGNISITATPTSGNTFSVRPYANGAIIGWDMFGSYSLSFSFALM